MPDSYITSQLQKSLQLKQDMLKDAIFVQHLEDAAMCWLQAYQSQKKILIAGNGGSAADAQHIAGELVSRFYFDRPALPSIALTTDTSILTAVGNDYGYHYLFSRQIEALGQEGDVFLGISTSGNSENILHACETAKQKGMKVIGLTGKSGGKMGDLCDICLKMPSSETPRIQEGHILVGHILCAYVEEKLFGASHSSNNS